MNERPTTAPTDVEQTAYMREVGTRLRFAGTATWLRASGLQFMWFLVVVAGAGVPLNRALDGPSWVEPALGFVVVVSAGIEKIAARATPAAVARDRLRRGLATERRRLASRTAPYDDPATAFATFVERTEAVIAAYDEAMILHQETLIRT